MEQVFISIICPVFNEEKYIKHCIETIIHCDYPQDKMEIFFVDGLSTDATRTIIEKYQAQYNYIHLIDNPHRIVPYALNLAIEQAKGEVIMRIDAHSEYPHNYFSVLVQKLFQLHADNVGGVCKTLPANDTPTAHAIAAAMSCSFGMGNSSFRIGAEEEQTVDTVPFGCYRSNIFKRLGNFDTDLIRNQDDEFNGRIIKHGGKIFLIPSIVIHYHARPTLKKTAQMFYQYGLFKPLVNKKLGSPATLRQFFPPLFILGIVFGAIGCFLHPLIIYIYFTFLLLYLLLAFYFSFKYSKNISEFFILIATFTLIHTSYGTGYIIGISKLLTHGNFQVKSSR